MKSGLVDDLLFCGDVHGKLGHIQRTIDKHKPKAVFLLGDIQAEAPLEDLIKGTDVYFISGNHDADTQAYHDNLFGSAYAGNNLHGRVIEINGLRIAGLGGVFHEDVWMPPGNPKYDNLKEWEDANRWNNPYFEKQRNMHRYGTIFYEDYLELMMQKADVLIVHDAPSCHPYGFEVLDELAREMGVHTVFHGDHHDSLDYSEDEARMGFKTYGVGLRGITSLSGKKVLEGELDKDRFESRMKKKSEMHSAFSLPSSVSMRPSFV